MNSIHATTLACLCAALLAAPQADPQTAETARFTIELANTWNQPKADEPVVIDLSRIGVPFPVRSAVVMDGTQEIPSQLDDLDGDRRADELALVIDLPAGGAKTLALTLSAAGTQKQYPARVFATMLVRGDGKKRAHAPVQAITVPGTTNFYNMLHGHGPMFESELAGYRIYFNEKQTVDPYGKFHKRLELAESQFYPNKEQLARGFGDDVLMVGNSCGVGALKGWDGSRVTHIKPIATRTERILAAGPVRTIVDVSVQGWQYQGKELDMTNRYTLYAGHRDLRVDVLFADTLAGELFCTGVQRVMGTETVADTDHQGLVGSWGRHWPVNDTVTYAKETIGLATCIPLQFVRQEVEDKDNYLYTVAAPGSDRFYYHTMFTSRKETFGYPDAPAWFAYMRRWKEALQHPVRIEVTPVR